VSSDTGEDPTSSGGFFESLISSFELGLTIEAIEVELRTERYVRNSSKFSIELEKIDIKKVKQKSPSIIHSIQGSLGGLEIKFQQIGDSSAKKFLALQRIIRKDEPLMCSEAFSLTMEVMKCPGKDSERRLVTRGNLASVQVVTTLLTALELFKLVDKALLFMMRQTYSQQGISELLEFYKNHRHEENFQDIGRIGF
jgi:hypothetical protein